MIILHKYTVTVSGQSQTLINIDYILDYVPILKACISTEECVDVMSGQPDTCHFDQKLSGGSMLSSVMSYSITFVRMMTILTYKWIGACIGI